MSLQHDKQYATFFNGLGGLESGSYKNAYWQEGQHFMCGEATLTRNRLEGGF